MLAPSLAGPHLEGHFSFRACGRLASFKASSGRRPRAPRAPLSHAGVPGASVPARAVHVSIPTSIGPGAAVPPPCCPAQGRPLSRPTLLLRQSLSSQVQAPLVPEQRGQGTRCVGSGYLLPSEVGGHPLPASRPGRRVQTGLQEDDSFLHCDDRDELSWHAVACAAVVASSCPTSEGPGVDCDSAACSPRGLGHQFSSLPPGSPLPREGGSARVPPHPCVPPA